MSLEQTLLALGCPPNVDDEAAQQTFIRAARYNCLPVVAAYLAHGMDVNAGDGRKTALIAAVEEQELAMLRFLIAAGANLDARDRDGDTALHTAANWKHLDALRLLAAYGASADTVNHKGLSPLSQAVNTNNAEVSRALLAAGADPNWLPGPECGADGVDFVPPLANAARYGTELVALLLEAGADPSLRYGPDGRTCWLDAILNQQTAVAEHNAELAQAEAVRAYDVGLVTAGQTQEGEPLAYWLEHGADPNARNDGRAALHYVAERGESPADVRLLLEAGTDPNRLLEPVSPEPRRDGSVKGFSRRLGRPASQRRRGLVKCQQCGYYSIWSYHDGWRVGGRSNTDPR
jgi:uncharacterized protein